MVTDEAPAWIAWPGVWGDTRAKVGGIDQPSPKGPSAHASWTNPDGALATAWEPQRKDAIAAPAVVISRDRGRMRVDFDFTRQPGPPAASLQVTVNSSDEAGVPPRTYTFQLAHTRRGTLATEVPLDPAKHYDIYASTTTGDPPIPSESVLTELDPVGKAARLPFAEQVLGGFGRLVARIRGQLGR
jgi:hypothetical protein